MKIVTTTVMADDGGVFDVVPLSRHHRCILRHQARDAPGETLDLGLLDQTMMAFIAFPLGGIVLEQVLAGGMVERCFIPHTKGSGYRRHGTVETRRLMCGDGLTQEEVVV